MLKLLFRLILFISFISTTAQAVPAEGRRIMVTSASPYAVQIVRDVADKGGNAVDAAVAVALSLAVTHPYYAAFGGGGLAVIKASGEIRALDFREVAPAQTGPDLFESLPLTASRTGGLAIGVPGVPAGLWEMHQKYGKLKWKQLFDGALHLAEEGFRVSGEWVANTISTQDRFTPTGLKFFFKDHGQPHLAGDLFKQPALGKFLRSYREHGPDAFYKGVVAQEIAQSVQSSGGRITPADLQKYRVRWLEPLHTDFHGYHLSLMPPPSSGGVITIEALKLMDDLKLSEQEPLSVGEFHRLIEILKLSYRGRFLLGDPDMSALPVDKLIDAAWLEKQAKLFKPDHALETEKMDELSFEKEQTTHFSVMDGAGNAVAMTITLNGDYGSGVVSEKTGIALNNEMDDFTTHVGKPNMFGLIQGAANLVRPGARPLSSMTPTVVEKDGQTVLAIGAPGGPRITSGVIQVIYRVLTQKFNIDQAIQAPRVHHQFSPNVVKYDDLRFSPETLSALRAKGHTLETGSTARVSGIFRTAEGVLQGACDSRGECAAGGY